jgi:hypothetical protein
MMGELTKNRRRNERIRTLWQAGYDAKEVVREIKKDVEEGLLPPRVRITTRIVYHTVAAVSH